MRFVSNEQNGFRVFAVSGTNTISFGIGASGEAASGLLGFAVERYDPQADERYVMPGYKVFPSVIPQPTPDTVVSTWDHPVQSFVWDDFTAKVGHRYEYRFYPVKGKPKNLERLEPIAITVRTEPLFGDDEHDVFFNRGVASSQAYRRRFGNLPPDKLGNRKDEALDWLMRDLRKAALRFIRSVQPGDALLGCFYEFRYEPIVRELKEAIDRGVDVRVIIDAKVNESTDRDGKFHPSFPRTDNLKLLDDTGFPMDRVVLREAKPADIQHNKFMVRMKGGTDPAEVWTGSTNISQGGFAGQTNVGHWVRNPGVAAAYRDYWEILSEDPGARAGDDRETAKDKNAAFRKAVGALTRAPTAVDRIESGITPVFSPRTGLQVLEMYARLLDSAKACSCVTLAFGISKTFKEVLADNTAANHIVFMLLEKRDKKNPRSKQPFVPLLARNNVYQAWGSYIQDPVYQWARETNAQRLGLNTHVGYVHSKFLMMDPLGEDPVVVTGSANFSEPSTNANDENMIIIRGNTRVADIYFTEFNRLFNHYYFRSVHEAMAEKEKPAGGAPAAGDNAEKPGTLFMDEDDRWTQKYAPGKLKAKRLALYTTMEGATTL